MIRYGNLPVADSVCSREVELLVESILRLHVDLLRSAISAPAKFKQRNSFRHFKNSTDIG